MDIFKTITDWITNNWGSFMIGTMSIGTIATTIIYTAKQWFASKAQTIKLNGMWTNAQEAIKDLKELYLKERDEKLEGLEREKELRLDVVAQQATQDVLFDILLKLALSSKLDSDDKITIVSNVERLKAMRTEEIIDEVVEVAKDTVTGTKEIIKAVKNDPTNVAVDTIKNVGKLLNKYNQKE